MIERVQVPIVGRWYCVDTVHESFEARCTAVAGDSATFDLPLGPRVVVLNDWIDLWEIEPPSPDAVAIVRPW